MEFLCQYCNKIIPEELGITALGGEWICDSNLCGTLDEENERTIRTKPHNLQTVYLGDGVYCDFESYGIVLKANDHLNPTDTIFLGIDELKQLFKICREKGIKL